ncbi:DUF5994 family protein [Actinomadura sp. NPDC049753]|uniref:DUF5994 family protein n=1 Tax=Actinomadura sp. NPDC049753 TaxID=3154739 RepID=UPI00343DECB9
MRATAEPGTIVGPLSPSAPRLVLQPSAPLSRNRSERGRTLLDGAWWPRSADPVAELPGLLLALRAYGPPDDRRPISHVLLRAADWDSHPRRLLVNGPDDTREVMLSWFDNLPAGLLTAIYADGRRVELLTVPAATGSAAAQATLERAADPAGSLPARDVPAAPTAPAEPRDGWGAEPPGSTSTRQGERLREPATSR